METYIEQDCEFKHEGQYYINNGAVITDSYLVAYVGAPINKNETTWNYKYPRYHLTDWHGNTLGILQVFSRWETPKSYISKEYYAINIWLIDGRCYKGRTAGQNMIVRAKRFIRKGKPAIFD